MTFRQETSFSPLLAALALIGGLLLGGFLGGFETTVFAGSDWAPQLFPLGILLLCQLLAAPSTLISSFAFGLSFDALLGFPLGTHAILGISLEILARLMLRDLPVAVPVLQGVTATVLLLLYYGLLSVVSFVIGFDRGYAGGIRVELLTHFPMTALIGVAIGFLSMMFMERQRRGRARLYRTGA